MTKKHLILFALLAITLTLLLSGCGKSATNLEGKYVATFDLNGGTLDTKTSNVRSRVNFAYEPGSYILDPSTYSSYKLTRSGYRFTGWYLSPECLESEKWDFAANALNVENLVLYAGWVKELVFTYSVCYVDGENTASLGSYTVSQGARFNDYRKFADTRTGFTSMGYFADAACTIPWNADNVHPGGDADTDVQVFVRYIEGSWLLVNNLSTLKSAIGNGNIYLTDNVDCGGETLSFGTLNHIFNGNGFTISNFTVEKSGGALIPSLSLFQSLGEAAVLRDVSFENVTYRLFDCYEYYDFFDQAGVIVGASSYSVKESARSLTVFFEN